ncbi:hypothetical protein Q8A73_019316 [Channa argus]|nr:hypothetical protein Q8A73_019316 [Channa argus]
MLTRLHLLGQTATRLSPRHGKVTAAQQEALSADVSYEERLSLSVEVSHLHSFSVSLPAGVCALFLVLFPEQGCMITAGSAGSLPLKSTLHNQVELPLQLLTTIRQDLGGLSGDHTEDLSLLIVGWWKAFRLLDSSSAGNYNEGFGFCCSVPESFLESGKSLHPLARLIIQTIIFYPPPPLVVCRICGDQRGWKLAEGIPTLTFSLTMTPAAEGRPDGLTLHFPLCRQRADGCQGVSGLAAVWALDEAGESMERGMMKK